MDNGWVCETWAFDRVDSEGSLLSSPALNTLFGRLPLAGDPAPPGPVDEGLLSPTKLEIRLSSSLRLSARPGVGDASYGL